MEKVGRYRINATLGQGGMATVYNAYDPLAGRDVAIKLLSARYLHIKAYHKRFEREAQTVARLEHRAIVPLYDFGEIDNQPYLVMRLMKGGSAADTLMKQGAFSFGAVVRLMERVASALDYAHQSNTIHRDLKPANILFDEEGIAYLADFGVARFLADYTTFTGSNEVIGTPAYMSPEMVRGRTLTHHSDLYALGAVVFKLLTGRNLFRANKPLDIAKMHVEAPVPQIRAIKPELPEGLQQVLEIALAKEPTDRYPSAGSLYQAIARLSHSAPQSQPPSPIIKKRLHPTSTGDTAEITRVNQEQLQTLQPVESDDLITADQADQLNGTAEFDPGAVEWDFEMTPRERLENQVSAELMACIGCNDCMLACPLPETSLVSIAELNFAISETAISNPNVISFVSACTQCQQCVPVCPADLSRADMVLWNKLKVEAVQADRPIPFQHGAQIEPSGWTIDTLASHLTHIPLFENVADDDLRRTLFQSTLRKLDKREILVREGDYHERLFVILDGAVEQLAASEHGNQTRIIILGAGSFHGETALMADQTEQFTVRALMESIVVEIPKTAVYQLMQLSPPFQRMMDGMYSQHALETHLQNAPLFAEVPDHIVRELLNAAELITVTAGQSIQHEGDAADAFYIVRSGFLRVSKGMTEQERVLLYFREGDTFGALPLLTNGRNRYTVSANTRTELVMIAADQFKRVLSNYPKIELDLIGRARQSKQIPADYRPPSSSNNAKKAHNTTQLDLSWTQLLDQGVLQGKEILIIDQNICTNCNNCVEGCGRRHGQTRLERSGLQLGNLLFPTACRHCEDPVCLLCSVNGIVREPNGEISIVDDNCIGCGACADRCPYDNITMHPRDPKKPGWLTSIWQSFRNLSQSNENDVIDLSHDVPQIAVKCDLCHGYHDYACVTACPVGAAFRVDPVEAFDISDMIIGLKMQN